MISGFNILATALLLSLSSITSLLAAPPDAAALIARLARPAPSSTGYVEVRFVRMLRKPVVLRGTLDYGGADKLGKRVEQPYKETTTIANDNVDVQREGRSPRHFSLDRAPELLALVGGFSALLGGDAAALEKLYTISLVDKVTNWTLTLTPRDVAFAKHLREIVVDGAGNEPVCFSLHETDGDASILLLGALTAARFGDAPTLPALESLCHRATP